VACAFKDGAHRLHISQIVGLFAGRFQYCGLVAQFGTRRESPKPIKPDVSFTDVVVTIAVSAERHFRVVEVEHMDAVESDLLGGLV
jgi:hypothetical protein